MKKNVTKYVWVVVLMGFSVISLAAALAGLIDNRVNAYSDGLVVVNYVGVCINIILAAQFAKWAMEKIGIWGPIAEGFHWLVKEIHKGLSASPRRGWM